MAKGRPGPKGGRPPGRRGGGGIGPHLAYRPGEGGGGSKHQGSTKPPVKKSGCCSYQEAGRALARLKFRLAIRYVRLDIKTRLGVI